MKIFKVSFGIICIIFLYRLDSFAAGNPDELKNLYENKRYFELSNVIQSNSTGNSTDLLFYKGAVSNKFNRLGLSINYINRYLAKSENEKEIKFKKDCYKILADNYAKLYQYQKAAESYKLLLGKCKGILDSESVADAENSLKLWKTFSSVPPQTVALNGDTKLKISKDITGLTNIPVTIGNDSVKFIFDTGANISTISRTYALKLNFKIFEDSIEVGTITGENVYASLGAAPSIKIGNVIIENAIFLVFNDKDLYIPQIKYQVNGIVGFPIIEGLKEVTITKSDSIFIPKNPKIFSIQNLCLDELSPIIMINYQGKNLSFHFDTGAKTTYLYQPFYKEYESFVKENSTKQDREIAGAGGSKKLSLYKLKNFNFVVGGKESSLQEVSVLSESLNEDSKYYYGNLGQDVIKKFDKMTINFESMSIAFE